MQQWGSLGLSPATLTLSQSCQAFLIFTITLSVRVNNDKLLLMLVRLKQVGRQVDFYTTENFSYFTSIFYFEM